MVRIATRKTSTRLFAVFATIVAYSHLLPLSHATDYSDAGAVATGYTGPTSEASKLEGFGTTTPDDTAYLGAVQSDGSYTLVWRAWDIYGENKVALQKFNADGTQSGSALTLGSRDKIESPQIIQLNDDGDLLVTWTGYNNSATLNTHSYAQVVYADPSAHGGATVGPEIDLGSSALRSVTSAHSGTTSVIVWANSFNLYMQPLDENGDKVGGAQVIGAISANTNGYPIEAKAEVTVLDNGNYVVSWAQGATSTATNTVLLSSSAQKIGNTQTLNIGGTDGVGDYETNVVSIGSDDLYAIVGASGGVVKMALVDGTTNVPEANSTQTLSLAGTSSNDMPSIAAVGSAGEFVVIWRGIESSQWHTYIQHFDADGVKDIPVGKFMASGGHGPGKVVGVGSEGDYVIAWASVTGGNYDVHTQKYNVDGSLDGPQLTYEGENASVNTLGFDIEAVGDDGAYIISYVGQDSAANGSDQSVYLARVDASGNKILSYVAGGSGDFDITTNLNLISGYYIATYSTGSLVANGSAYASGSQIPVIDWQNVKLNNAEGALYDLVVTATFPVTINEDSILYIHSSGLLADGYSQSLFSVQNPAQGSAVLNGELITYTPVSHYYGADSFTFKISNNTADTYSGTVLLNIDSVNDQPVANAQSVTVTEDISSGVTLTGTDIEGSSLSYSIVSSPASGVLSGTPPNLTYTANADFNGADSFTFKVNDGALDSTAATVSLTVNAVNDLPTAIRQSVTVTEDITKAITLNGTDVDGDSLTYSLVSSPSNGVLTGTIPNLSYTPNADYNGADSFTFKVNDGTGDSGTAIVSITVNAVNDAPVADAQSVAVTEDVARVITLTSSDSDGDTLTYSIVSSPADGTLSGTLPNITYTPDADFNGADSFTFKVNDGTEDSAAATVTLTIAAVNDLPTANAQSVTVTEDIAKAITLSGADVDGDNLTYSLVSSPSNGVLTGTIPNFSYTPNADYNGADSFSFKVNDGSGDSNTAMISINVVEKNDAPVANSQTLELVQGTAVDILLGASDPEGQSLSYLLTSYPEQGVLSGSEANLTYTPDANFSGSDSFNFIANDGELDSNTAVVTLVVLGDLDGDGIPDNQDADDDGDGIDDLTEGTGDSDGDGIPDYRDTDSDNDGIPDEKEGLTDSDGDGIPDYLDISLDEDRDGIPDIIEGPQDWDKDGVANYLDIDSDNDGLLDGYEADLSGIDADADGIDDRLDTDQTLGVDVNGDGIDDNVTARDSDKDGSPDYLDTDSDDDRISDYLEASSARLDADGDGIADPYDTDNTLGQDLDTDGIDDSFDIDYTGFLDADLDGISDTHMREQDTDSDGLQDYRDLDADNDGLIDTAEAAGRADGKMTVLLQGEIHMRDSDGDGIADHRDLDSDNDGIPDVVEAGGVDINQDGLVDAANGLIVFPLDSDSDGVHDFYDLDSDNDGIFDIVSISAHLLDDNTDGRIDQSADRDFDGIDDAWDNAPDRFGTAAATDPDGDGVPIALDLDNDNDGLSDLVEGLEDTDQDNVPDYLDRDSDNDGLSDTFDNRLPSALGLDSDLDGIDDAWDIDAVGGLDDDNDGIADRFKPQDTNENGTSNQRDIDTDGDTIPDSVEQLLADLAGIDANLNGVDDAIDVLITLGEDVDQDGIDDDAVAAGTISDMGDVDQDGILNFMDLDSDGDCIPDQIEGIDDTDRDGIPNFLDPDSDNDGIPDEDENDDANNDGINDRLQVYRYPPHELRVDYGSGSLNWSWVVGIFVLIGWRRRQITLR
ncbi:Ig-like domain-containing protein [Shewanella submarina]|uniref:Tandem-95 repeat protein n=1 Tax=Shewanella submarina TaxID=2016376 RepID=A0ABV7GCT9_9GAMM|nr:Ig-like domain-containing protein [Shewanella submarina]MCL1038530.1 Ig-like domain-containing protein [Shewanella submarina]